MLIQTTSDGFDLILDGRLILRHRENAPCLYVGHGDARMDMYRGNFDIEDYVVERTPLTHAIVSGTEIAFSAAAGQPARLVLTLSGDERNAVAAFHSPDASVNRVWLRVAADPEEHVWGGGEQMSYFDMRGRRFPLWTSEPGVGRDKTTEITFKADVSGKSGGDYLNTNYPQPTYLSSPATSSMWRRRPIRPSTSAVAISTKSRPGPCRSGSSSRRVLPSSLSSRPCQTASAVSRRCRNGSMAVRSSA